LRTLVTRARWFVSGLEMLLVGSVAAAVAYLVGHLLRRLT
jgi:VIT1/CCC1 family predicted Fe2+/Mn2+ transporter